MKQVAIQWLQVEKWSPELISIRGNETGCMYPFFQTALKC
jgi:hypothetical protein